jgi:hypothetical protein
MRPVRDSRLLPVGVCLAALTGLVAVFDPATTRWFPSCPFHAITGWLCPLCGSLRAVHALARGEPVVALAFNPIVVVGPVIWLIARERTMSWCFSARGLMLLAAFGLLRNL